MECNNAEIHDPLLTWIPFLIFNRRVLIISVDCPILWNPWFDKYKNSHRGDQE